MHAGERGPSRARVDNEARTAEHLELMARRRAALRGELAGILPPTGELIWEVGCGHGHFLTTYARAHPDALCLGIDIIRERIERAERKKDRAGLSNLHFLLAEARLFLGELPPAAKILAVFILFPDPWPKKRHHKHRLMQPEFLDALAERAGQGTRIYFRTDHEPYFLQAETVLSTHPAWHLADETWPCVVETVFQQRAARHRSLVAVRR